MFPVKKIICPTDFSPRSHKAIAAALGLSHALAAELVLVHIVETAPRKTGGAAEVQSEENPYEAMRVALSMADAVVQLHRVVREHLPDSMHSAAILVHRAMPDNLPESRGPRAHVACGEPAERIVRLAELEKADLIVITAHGSAGARPMPIETIAERVIRLAPCSVYLAHCETKETRAPEFSADRLSTTSEDRPVR